MEIVGMEFTRTDKLWNIDEFYVEMALDVIFEDIEGEKVTLT